MIDRSTWEYAVKDERQAMLDRTHDPQSRRMVAAVIDAFCDRLYERLETNEVVSRMADGIKGGRKS